MTIPAPDERYPNLDVVFSSIRMYADRQKLTPPQVADLFHAGIAACHVLRPDWLPVAEPAAETADA